MKRKADEAKVEIATLTKSLSQTSAQRDDLQVNIFHIPLLIDVLVFNTSFPFNCRYSYYVVLALVDTYT